MRINRLTVKNFKGFVDQSFDFPRDASQPGNGSFHLLIGQNGKGKTSALDALAVAVGSWLLGVPGYVNTSRPIGEADIRLEVIDFDDTSRIEKQYPVLVQAEGIAAGEALSWGQERTPENASAEAAAGIRALAQKSAASLQADTTLPLIAYYGTGRLWHGPEHARAYEPKSEQIQLLADDFSEADLGVWGRVLGPVVGGAEAAKQLFVRALAQNFVDRSDFAQDFASRLAGYRDSIDPRCSPRDLLNWLKFEQQLAVQEQRESNQFAIVKEAIKQSVEGCTKVDYHLRLGLLLSIDGQPRLPFGTLSDGQRNMIAMVGDIAHKAAQLNPQFGRDALTKTPGVVLVDELDLHLHPRWQLHIVEDLRRLFPEIQFIASTHSPFIVQTAREGELIKLDGEISTEAPGKSLEEVARLIMDVTNTACSPRYQEMLDTARTYLALVDESKSATPARRKEIQSALAGMLAPFTDNPAYTAFLERKGYAALQG